TLRAARLLPRASVVSLRLPLRLRAPARAGRLILRDGRQPRQLAGQSLLGIRQAPEDPRKGFPDLLVVERGHALASVAPAGDVPAIAILGGAPPPSAISPGIDCLGRRSNRGDIMARALDTVSNESLEAWQPDGTRLGAYLHLPFCIERCGYCSFNTAPYTPHAMDRFVAALLREIDLVSRAPWSASVTLRSV